LSALIREALKAQWSKDIQVPLDVVVHHLASSLIALLTWWVEHDLRYPPKHINEMYQQLTQPAVAAMLG